MRLWAERHSVDSKVIRNQGVYALEQVQPLPKTSGTVRAATGDDEQLLLDWMVAFGEEVLAEGDPGRDEARAMVAHRLGPGDGGFTLNNPGTITDVDLVPSP